MSEQSVNPTAGELPVDPAQADLEEPDVYGYPSGEHLDEKNAFAVTRANPTRVILLAGPANSGKTTLIASLYEQFHEGLFAGFLFAGSRTLVGFEQRCHLARRASGRESPDTARTPFSPDIRMLHLRVARPETIGPGRTVDLLFTDIYGEAFRLAADSEEECRELFIFRRADHVTILLDGASFREPRNRQKPFNNADSLLRLATDTGMLDTGSNVQLVVTKRDLIDGEGADARNSFIANKKSWLENRYSGKVGKLDWFEVAARPEVAGIAPGLGLDRLLQHWAAIPRRFYNPTASSVSSVGFATEFDRFSVARPVEGDKIRA